MTPKVRAGRVVDRHPAVLPERPRDRDRAARASARRDACVAAGGERAEVGVGRGVVGLAGVARDGRAGREEDEGFERQVRRGPVQVNRAVDLRGQDRLPFLGGLVLDVRVVDHARGVDDSVDGAVPLPHLCDEVAHLLPAGDVRDGVPGVRSRVSQFGEEPVRSRTRCGPADEDEPRAFGVPCDPAGDDGPDAAGAAGDQVGASRTPRCARAGGRAGCPGPDVASGVPVEDEWVVGVLCVLQDRARDPVPVARPVEDEDLSGDARVLQCRRAQECGEGRSGLLVLGGRCHHLHQRGPVVRLRRERPDELEDLP